MNKPIIAIEIMAVVLIVETIFRSSVLYHALLTLMGVTISLIYICFLEQSECHSPKESNHEEKWKN